MKNRYTYVSGNHLDLYNGTSSFGVDQGYFIVGSLGNFLKLTKGAHNINLHAKKN